MSQGLRLTCLRAGNGSWPAEARVCAGAGARSWPRCPHAPPARPFCPQLQLLQQRQLPLQRPGHLHSLVQPVPEGWRCPGARGRWGHVPPCKPGDAEVAVAFPGQVLLVSLLVVTEAVEQSVSPAELCTGLFRLYAGQGTACPADELGPIPMNAAVSWLNPGPSSAAARCRGRWRSVEPPPLSSVLWLFHPCEQGRAARDARHGSASSLLGKRWFGLTRREMKWKLCRAARLPPRVSSAGSTCSGEPPAPRPPGAALAFHQLFLLI